jgi:hypothetical protein
MIRPSDYLSEIRGIDVILATGAGDAPVGGLLEITGFDSDGFMQVQQPSADSIAAVNLCVAISSDITEGQCGRATKDFPIRVLYESADGTPAIAASPQSWGSGAASWKLRLNKSGFNPLAGIDGSSAVFDRATSAINCSCSALPAGWTDLGTNCEIDLIERGCASDNSKIKRTNRICLTTTGFKVVQSPWAHDTDPAPAPPP